MPTRIRRSVLVVLAVLAALPALALAVTPKSGAWVGKVVKGQALKGKNGEPTFSVRSGHIRRFSIGGIGAYCAGGYSVVSVYVPSARIRNGRFSVAYHPGQDATVKLSGRFTNATHVRGTVTGSGNVCLYDIGFTAHRR
jgi:hypothetical protein